MSDRSRVTMSDRSRPTVSDRSRATDAPRCGHEGRDSASPPREDGAARTAGLPRPPALPPPVAPPAVRERPAGRSRAQVPSTAAPPPDVGELLRDHVVPALVRRGDLGRQERPGLVLRGSSAMAPLAPPAPGTLTVAAGRVDIHHGDRTGTASPGTTGPRTTVHIDRVVVTRAPTPAPPPAPPAPRPRPRVDHQAYLARRRDQR